MNPQQSLTGDAMGAHGLVLEPGGVFREISRGEAESEELESSALAKASQWTSRPRSFEHIVNLKELMERVDDDTELLRELFGILQQEYPDLQSALQTAVSEKCLPHIQSRAHALKGMLANLAVTQGAAAAADVEQYAREGNQAGIVSALGRLECEMTSLLPCVDQYLAGMSQ